MRDKEVLRQINIEGCKVIGIGNYGTVYKIGPDEVVKVYREDVPFERIQAEKEKARRAFILGIPTAISFDIVRVGEHFGAVYELMDARPTAEYINESRENLDDYVEKSVQLLKKLHKIDPSSEGFADMKEQHLGFAEYIRDIVGDQASDKLRDMVLEIPDRTGILHGDFHIKNIFICGDELMLIDMDTLSHGDFIFDLATICNSYIVFPSIDARAVTEFLGISVETAKYIWKRTLALYLDKMSVGELQLIENKCKILGLLRILAFAKKGEDKAHQEIVLRGGTKMLHALLQKY